MALEGFRLPSTREDNLEFLSTWQIRHAVVASEPGLGRDKDQQVVFDVISQRVVAAAHAPNADPC